MDGWMGGWMDGRMDEKRESVRGEVENESDFPIGVVHCVNDRDIVDKMDFEIYNEQNLT